MKKTITLAAVAVMAVMLIGTFARKPSNKNVSVETISQAEWERENMPVELRALISCEHVKAQKQALADSVFEYDTRNFGTTEKAIRRARRKPVTVTATECR